MEKAVFDIFPGLAVELVVQYMMANVREKHKKLLTLIHRELRRKMHLIRQILNHKDMITGKFSIVTINLKATRKN